MVKLFGGSQLTIVVGRDRVTFELDGERTVVEPTLHLDAPPPDARMRTLLISGVGADRPSKPAACTLRLFHNDDVPHEIRAEKEEYLSRFFRFCLEILVRRAIFSLKPAITVYGANELDAHLCGYSRVLLRYALTEAGARTVLFADS